MPFPQTNVTAFDGINVPTREDPANFNDRAEDGWARLKPGGDQMSILAGQVNVMATSANEAATAAAGSASSAAEDAEAAAASALAAAASAAAAAQLSSTSATFNTLQTGSVTFITQAGAGYKPGVAITFVDRTNPARKMAGTVTTYSGSTLVAYITYVQGSGTASDWNISVSGEQGPPGPIGGVAGGTVTGTLNINGSATAIGMVVKSVAEKVTIVTTSPAPTFDYDVTAQNVMYFTAPAIGAWTPNIKGSSAASLDALMAVEQALSIVIMASQGATAYKPAGLKLEGLAVTPLWQGGAAPVAGNPSSIDSYTYTVVKVAANTFTVLASQSQFK